MACVLDSENGTGNIVREKFSKRSFVSVMRRFSDITNTHQPKSPNKDEFAKPIVYSSAKDYIEQLQKENAALLKLLADRNKFIELSSHELQKLRFNLQKAHQQNWQLAQANSQMLAELNIIKDKLKVQQHEHCCITAMLKTKNSELMEKVNKLSKQIILSCEVPKETAQYEEMKNVPKTSNPRNQNRRRHSENPSLYNSTVTQQDVALKGRMDNKRVCLRRRSSTVECKEPESKDLFEIEDAKFSSPLLVEDCQGSLDNRSAHCDLNVVIKPESNDKEVGIKIKDSSRCQMQESHRMSLGRPVRRAAEKVGSYKEIPLNVKMRRSN